MPFGAECFFLCLWVKCSLWSTLAPLCRGLSSINNQLLSPCCWNFLFGIGLFPAAVWGLQELYHLLLSWALTRFKSSLAPTDSCGRQEQESCWIWGGRALSQQVLRKQTQVRRSSGGFPYGNGILFV